MEQLLPWQGLPLWLNCKKKSAYNAGDVGSIPGLGRSSGEGKGYPLQYSGLENSMDNIVHGVANSQTWVSDFHSHFLPWKSLNLAIYLVKFLPMVHKYLEGHAQLSHHFLKSCLPAFNFLTLPLIKRRCCSSEPRLTLWMRKTPCGITEQLNRRNLSPSTTL